MKLRFHRTGDKKEFRIKGISSLALKTGAGSMQISDVEDFRTSKFVSFTFSDYIINERDGIKLIFEYDWNKK